jgi:carbamoyl-phosphate synthase small subunit
MRAAVSTVEDDPQRLLERVLSSPGMSGADLARIVTTPQPYTVAPPSGTATRYRVAAVDLGIKAATPQRMAQRGMEVKVMPATSTAANILAGSPDGVFFSNGPGDPAAAGYAVAAMRGVLEAGVPLFGICFGSQILSRAIGLDTYKLRYGHRGVNQPVMDLGTGRVYITSHNHGFAAALPDEAGEVESGTGGGATAGPREDGSAWAHVPRGARKPFGTPFGAAQITHVNLNDGVVEGLRLLDKPAFAVQYHPEAAPGPHDAVDLFDQFAELMNTGLMDTTR